MFDPWVQPITSFNWASVKNEANSVALECLNKCGWILFFILALDANSLSKLLIAVWLIVLGWSFLPNLIHKEHSGLFLKGWELIHFDKK